MKSSAMQMCIRDRTDISQNIFGQYDVYTSAIKQALRNEYAPTPKERRNLELYDERINKLFKSRTSFSIAELNSLADCDHTIENHFKQLGAAERNGKQEIDLFSQIETAYAKASDILSGKHGNIGQSEAETALVKNLLDAYKSLQQFIKPLLGHGDEAEKDNEFDAKLRAAWDCLLYTSSRSEMAKDNLSTHSAFTPVAVTGGYFQASMMMFPSNSLGRTKASEDLKFRSCLTDIMMVLSGSGFSLV